MPTVETNLNYLSFQSVSKSFLSPSQVAVPVLVDVTFEIRQDRFSVLVGPNGCGKTTILRLAAGLVKPDSGSICFGKHNCLPHDVGFLWQNYRESLMPWLDAQDNIAFPLQLKGVPIAQRRERARKLLNEFLPGVDPRAKCSELSGGQLQMVSLLRALAADSQLILADEPYSALDNIRRLAMVSAVEAIWRERHITTLWVTHDIDEAVLLADDILLFSKREKKVAEILHNPMPRPRTTAALSHPEHLECRRKVFEFLASEQAFTEPK